MPDPCTWCALDLHGHGDGLCGCQDCAVLHEHDLADNEHHDEAVNIVALRVIANLSEAVDDEWGNYPEIGETDWRAVHDRVAFIAGEMRPDDGPYFEAYGLLERRAIRWEADHA